MPLAFQTVLEKPLRSVDHGINSLQIVTTRKNTQCTKLCHTIAAI